MKNIMDLTKEEIDAMTDEELDNYPVEDMMILPMGTRARCLKEKFWDNFEEVMRKWKEK